MPKTAKKKKCEQCGLKLAPGAPHAPAYCQYRAALAPPWKKNPKSKYNAKRCSDQAGRSYMSQGERDCAAYLQNLERAGLIRDLEYQVSLVITEAQLRYVMDFRFFDVEANEIIWADYKGFLTERWKVLISLWPHHAAHPLRVYGGRGDAIRISEEIKPRSRGSVMMEMQGYKLHLECAKVVLEEIVEAERGVALPALAIERAQEVLRLIGDLDE